MSNREFAIKYQKIKLTDTEYLLIPESLIEGYSVEDIFYSVDAIKILNLSSLENENYIAANLATIEDILAKYDYAEVEEDFLLKYYFEELKDKLLIATIKDGKVTKKELDINLLRKDNLVHSIEMSQDGPRILLNDVFLNRILSCQTSAEMRHELLKLKDQLNKFSLQNKAYGTTRMLIKDGKIVEMEDNGQVAISNGVASSEAIKKDTPVPTDFSKKGLVKYLKERIYGHDKEIEIIATTISRNLKPNAERNDVESLLVIGPTGTGKTATFEAIGEYYSVPFRVINTPSLVPEGIVGKSIEDYLFSIIQECEGDIKKAERSILLFDEFDKVAKGGLDVKTEIIDELYKFMEGAHITIKKGSNYLNSKMMPFDTGMTSRVYSGVFEDAYKREKSIGFGSSQTRELKFDLDNLFHSTIFNKELFDRIPYKLLFDELKREDKKKAMLSKIGIIYKKRDMLKRLYGVDLTVEDTFIETFLDYIESTGHSMRDLNNLISNIVIEAENVISDEEGKYKSLILTRDTVEDPKNYKLS